MSGLRSQRERMMTWVSLRSGVASSGKCIIDHVPHTHAAATNAKIKNLFRTENVMSRLIIRAPRSGIRGAPQPVVDVLRGILQELIVALIRAEDIGLAAVRF